MSTHFGKCKTLRSCGADFLRQTIILRRNNLFTQKIILRQNNFFTAKKFLYANNFFTTENAFFYAHNLRQNWGYFKAYGNLQQIICPSF